MGLKAVFKTMKKEGYIIKKLDQYLLSLNGEKNDRAINVNSPSQAGACMRANYYARLQYPIDSNAIDPRARRIFDNGHHTHERLQTYLKDCGLLIMEEVPLRNDEYNIQGHTDGFLNLATPKISITFNYPIKDIVKVLDINMSKVSTFDIEDVIFEERNFSPEIGILEIKTINSRNYANLKDAKENHKQQAMIYMFCSEERRKYLRKTYETYEEFKASEKERIKYFKSLYEHLEDGNKYTREEKLLYKVIEHLKTDEVLYHCPRPINKVIFLYENKDTQELKEFVVIKDDEILADVLARYTILNECVANRKLPEREGTSKNAPPCKWCSYKIECWN
ncbi:MAG: hypothetical protein H0Z24_05575 [Thermosipho sp. (in: Bacteria)]|nr:hypothetical protein [Thermosipho sp. (in: thermotogales)]